MINQMKNRCGTRLYNTENNQSGHIRPYEDQKLPQRNIVIQKKMTHSTLQHNAVNSQHVVLLEFCEMFQVMYT